jgi:hypothetical protein
MSSNGGVSQLARLSLIPVRTVPLNTTAVYAFNPLAGFNDIINPSFYAFRVEEVIAGRTPTISRIILTYRDLGIVTVTFSLFGTNDAGQIVSALTMPSQASASTTIVLGNSVATNRLLTKIIGIQLTAQNIQLTIQRGAGAGALSISEIRLCGRIENQEYA